MRNHLAVFCVLFTLSVACLVGCGGEDDRSQPSHALSSRPLAFYATARADFNVGPAISAGSRVMEAPAKANGLEPGELTFTISSPSVFNAEDKCTCAELQATWNLQEPATEEEEVQLLGRFEQGGVFIGEVDPLFFEALYYKAGDPPAICTEGIHPAGSDDYEHLATATLEAEADSLVFPSIFFCGNFYELPPQGYEETIFLAVGGFNPHPRTRIVFASDRGYQGDLGGLAGADGLCNDMAAEGGLPSGDYRAWMSDATDSPSTRFTHDGGPFQLPDGGIVAQDWADLVDGELNDAIAVNFWGGFVDVAAFVWTNTNWRGEIVSTSPEENCSSWTSSDQEQMGAAGRMHWGGENWTYAGTGVSCADEEQYIYCFQQ